MEELPRTMEKRLKPIMSSFYVLLPKWWLRTHNCPSNVILMLKKDFIKVIPKDNSPTKQEAETQAQ